MNETPEARTKALRDHERGSGVVVRDLLQAAKQGFLQAFKDAARVLQWMWR